MCICCHQIFLFPLKIVSLLLSIETAHVTRKLCGERTEAGKGKFWNLYIYSCDILKQNSKYSQPSLTSPRF